jgi:uncharacterized integral membrane protein
MDNETPTAKHDEPAEPKPPKNWSLISRLLFGAIIAAGFMVFVFQNTVGTDVKFLGWDRELPTSILMLICAVVGVIVWELAGFVSRRARKKD